LILFVAEILAQRLCELHRVRALLKTNDHAVTHRPDVREAGFETSAGRFRARPLYKRVGAGLCCGRLKVGCAKDTDWLLFDPNEIRRFAHEKKGIIKNGEEKS
jgi:hypothetical protein